MLSCDFDAMPVVARARVPGTPGRVAAAEHIAEHLVHFGWSVARPSFTGHQYDGLSKPAHFRENGWTCSGGEDHERMLGLTFENVVADLGSQRDVTLLMAHYDSKQHANRDGNIANRTQPVLGANDGASGVGVLLEAARHFGSKPPASHLRFLLVDGEDGFDDCHPLAGSIHYAQGHKPPSDYDLPVGGERIVRVINLDMVGDPKASFCYDSEPADRTESRDRWKAAASALGVTAYSHAGDCDITDDHTAFADAGYATLDIIDYGRGFPAYWHTTHDTPDKLTPARLAETGRVLVEFVRRLSEP